MEAQSDMSVEAQTEVVVEDVDRKLRNSRNHQPHSGQTSDRIHSFASVIIDSPCPSDVRPCPPVGPRGSPPRSGSIGPAGRCFRPQRVRGSLLSVHRCNPERGAFRSVRSTFISQTTTLLCCPEKLFIFSFYVF